MILQNDMSPTKKLNNETSAIYSRSHVLEPVAIVLQGDCVFTSAPREKELVSRENLLFGRPSCITPHEFLCVEYMTSIPFIDELYIVNGWSIH